jgi:hypothetical protein
MKVSRRRAESIISIDSDNSVNENEELNRFGMLLFYYFGSKSNIGTGILGTKQIYKKKKSMNIYRKRAKCNVSID